MGFAETSLAEAFRPPTWLASSEISAEGAYVRGPRVPVEDPVTRIVPATAPVARAAGEPARNSAWRHPLGTDAFGRDLLVRLLYGARTSLAVGLLSAAALFAIGVLVGAGGGTWAASSTSSSRADRGRPVLPGLLPGACSCLARSIPNVCRRSCTSRS
jgi:ABC-type dipeptide/oligopeptide/nickel transport system permease subunit